MGLFPLKFSAMSTGCWHWVHDSGHTRCQQSWYFNLTDKADLETAEVSLEEWKKMGNRPRIDNEPICNACLPLLQYAVSSYLNKETPVKNQFCVLSSYLNKETPVKNLDLSKPVVLCSDGSSHQADKKTIKAAKDLAKILIEDNLTLSASVFVPHTTIKHRPSIQVTRCKTCS